MTAVRTFETPQLDPWLTSAGIGLVCLGAVMVGSSSIAFADQNTGEPLYFFFQHLVALALGGALALGAACLPMALWHRLHWLVLLAALGLLVIVLLPGFGVTVNGSTRWIEFGPLRLQASEPARVLLIMYLASYAVRHHRDLVSSFPGFAKPMLIVGAAALLLLAEPDFGAVVVLTATSLGILFAAGARIRDLSVVAAASGVALGALAFSEAYRIERLMTFRRPFDDPFASGFQLVQSLIAIGRGDWLGVGLGDSVQKLFYLPEAHTDFVFAVLAEELGLVGATLVIALFSIVVYRAIRLGQSALARGLSFQGLIAIGIGLMIGLQASINIGVNTGLLPTKGLTLPLISYGRSSTVVTLAAFGLLFRVYHELKVAERKTAATGDRR